MFQVAVPQPGKRDLLYPSFPGAKSLTLMQLLTTRGLSSVAHTAANGIPEILSLADMADIYGEDTAKPDTPPNPPEPGLYAVSGRNEGEKEDAVYLLWSSTGHDLHELFKARIYADSAVEQNTP